MNMKMYLGFAACLVLGAAFALVDATAQQTTDQIGVENQQTETREFGREGATADRTRQHQGYKASELLGLNVRGRTGDDDIGEIEDLMIGNDGKVKYAAVSFGGFLGIGEKMFAVPFQAIEFVRSDDDLYARIDVNEEQLKNMEGFDQENWPDQSNRNFAGQRRADRPGTIDSDVPQ
jgi:hypothetical protein